MAVLSKMVMPSHSPSTQIPGPVDRGSRKRREKQKVKRLGAISSPAHTEVIFKKGSGAQIFMLPEEFAQISEEINLIPCKSRYAAWYFGDYFAATSAELQRGVPVCIAYGPPDPKLGVPVSCWVRWQKVWEDPIYMEIALNWLDANNFDHEAIQVANDVQRRGGVFHEVTHAAETAQIQNLRNAQTVETSSEPGNFQGTCIICMLHKAEYKWSNCEHPAEGVSLVCLSCTNVIVKVEQNRLRSTKRTLCTPCPICRRRGRLQQWRR